jgi:hypothetical protein
MILVNGENYPLTFIYLYAYGMSGYRAFSQTETATQRSCPTFERRRKYTMGQPARKQGACYHNKPLLINIAP